MSIIVQRHPYHLVDASPWPLITSMSAFLLVSGGVMYMHQYVGGLFMLTSGFFLVLSSMSIWFRDVIREGTFQGHHTRPVQISLR
jgi:hypothetical protein